MRNFFMSCKAVFFRTSGYVYTVICLPSTTGRVLKVMFAYTYQGDGGIYVTMAFVASLLARSFWCTRRTRKIWLWCMAFMREKVNAHWVLARKPEEKRLIWLTCRNNIKINLSFTICEDMDSIWADHLPEESNQVWCVWVWSWSLDNEEALTHCGLLHHKNGLHLSRLRVQWRAILHTVTKSFVPQGAGRF